LDNFKIYKPSLYCYFWITKNTTVGIRLRRDAPNAKPDLKSSPKKTGCDVYDPSLLLLEPSLLRKAISAENRSALGGLERDFALFAALGANGLVHLSGPEVSSVRSFFETPFSESHSN
jgi:hypothetical protein